MSENDSDTGPSEGQEPLEDHQGAFGGGFDPMRWQSDDDLPASVDDGLGSDDGFDDGIEEAAPVEPDPLAPAPMEAAPVDSGAVAPETLAPAPEAPSAEVSDAGFVDGDDWMPTEEAAPFEASESLADLEGAAGGEAFLDEASPIPTPGAGGIASDGLPVGEIPGPAGGAADGLAPDGLPAGDIPGPAGDDQYPSFEIPSEDPQPAKDGRKPAAAAPAPVDSHGGRITPHDLAAERCVIGALLIHPDRLVEVTEIAKPEDFYDKRHKIVLAAMIEIDRKGHPLDLVTLTANLKAVGTLGDVGGAAYLAQLHTAVPTSAHLKHHAAIVAETSKLRSLIGASGTIIERSFETPPDPEEVQTLIDESEASIFAIASKGETRGATAVSNILEDVFHSIEAQATRGEFTGIPSGFYDLDEMLGGFNPGEMTVIAARPAMGKTAFVLNIMDHAATQRAEALGYAPSVLFFSLEMGRASIVQRMLVARAGVEAHRIRQGRLHDREYQDLVEAAGVLRDARLFIDDTPGISIMALRSRARRVKAEHGLDMIVIDYLQLLSAKAESRQQEISIISRSLKELSRELEVPLITLAQLSRSVESREEKRPQLSDLRESGSIEQDADVVLMLYRAEYYFPIDENKGKAEALVVKHRNGSTGTVELQFEGAKLRFSNREPSMSEPITGL